MLLQLLYLSFQVAYLTSLELPLVLRKLEQVLGKLLSILVEALDKGVQPPLVTVMLTLQRRQQPLMLIPTAGEPVHRLLEQRESRVQALPLHTPELDALRKLVQLLDTAA